MRLIITRHGETEENRTGIIQGHLPGKLSPLGIEQAKKVAKRLKEEKIDFIFSSDLARASDTAKEIAKFHSNIPIEFTQELRERNLGEFQGKKTGEVDWNAKDSKIDSLKPTDGETIKDIYERGEKFLHKIISKHHKDTVLLVGHNGINKVLIGIITGKKYGEISSMENQYNTSVNIFEIDENRNHKIYLLNDTEHLE